MNTNLRQVIIGKTVLDPITQSEKFEITINEYGWFHQWIIEYIDNQPYISGIIEFHDGSVNVISYTNIKFTDHPTRTTIPSTIL